MNDPQSTECQDTITAKEAEIGRLTRLERMLRTAKDDAVAAAHEAQSEATHLRKGIETLINGPYVEQTVDSILDRLKAILEETKTDG